MLRMVENERFMSHPAYFPYGWRPFPTVISVFSARNGENNGVISAPNPSKTSREELFPSRTVLFLSCSVISAVSHMFGRMAHNPGVSKPLRDINLRIFRYFLPERCSTPPISPLVGEKRAETAGIPLCATFSPLLTVLSKGAYKPGGSGLFLFGI